MKSKLLQVITVTIFTLVTSLSSHSLGQVTIFSEGFENINGFSIEGALSTTPVGNNGWRSSALAATNANNWAGFTHSNSITGRSLMIAAADASANQYPGQYFSNLTTNKYAYATVNATGYTNITLTFKWKCYGDFFSGTLYDYGIITYNTGSGWQNITTGGTYGNGRYGAGDSNIRTASVTFPISADNKSFQFGFRWINDNVDGFAPAFVIDDIIIRGTPIATDRTLTVSEAYTGATYANGNHTIANNTSVTATSGTRAGYVVTGWTGTGSVPATGTGGTTTFTISQNSSITWLWEQLTAKNIKFHNYGGSEQLTFNNSRINTIEPVFRLSHESETANEYQIEINTASDFTGTSWTQSYTGTYPINTEANFSFTNSFLPVNNTTYYVRARAKASVNNAWSAWTTETYSFTYQTPKDIPDWFQTTQAQFSSDVLSGVTANAGGNVVTLPGGDKIINGSFEPNLNGWTIVKPGWYTVASEAYGNTLGTNALNIYNSNPSSFGNFNGDTAGVYQTVNMTGVSTIMVDFGYESTTGSNLNVNVEIWISETNQTSLRSGTKIEDWRPTQNVTMGNARSIDVSALGFTGNKLIKIVTYLAIPSSDFAERYFYVDNLRAIADPQGTITSTPIHLASVQGATAYEGATWNQTLGGGDFTLKVQQSADGISGWIDVAGYDNISETGDGEKTFDLSGMTAYEHIRLVGSLDGANVVLHDWSVQFQTEELDCSIETIWDGSSWSHNVPDESTYKIIFEGNYDSSADTNYPATTGLIGCSVEVREDAEVVIASGHSITIENEIVVDNANGATFTVKSDANLLQVNAGVENEGNIIVERSANVPSNQYNFWTSPVKEQLLYQIYPGILSGKVMRYNTQTNYFNAIPANSQSEFGKGYSIRGSSLSEHAPNVTAIFIGIPQNESTDPVENETPLSRVSQRFNLIGNPFPSNLDIQKLNMDVSNAGKIENSTFYFWDNTDNTAYNQQGNNYVNQNYANYNAIANIGTAAPRFATGGKKPNGIVKPGQGFIVQATAATTGGLVFTNEMRTKETKLDIGDDDAVYFKNENKDASDDIYGSRPRNDKFWLELVNPADMHIQIAVGYFKQAENTFDIYDSKILSEGVSDNLYSLSKDAQKLSIQGRSGNFEDTDVIPLGVKFFVQGKYKIQLEDTKGIFKNHQAIYLKDKYLNEIHNLSESFYDFEGTPGVFEDRFEIIFKDESQTYDPVLTTVNDNHLKIIKKDRQIEITSSRDKILEVEIFNLSGWSIYKNEKVNSKVLNIPASLFGKQIIFVKVMTETGEIETKKIINK